MFKKIIKFIKYNTMVTAIITVGFIAVASVMAANDDVKKIIGEEIVERNGVDNTVLLAADLEEFDLKMEITNALEDEENFYIDYQYKTLAIKDNVWQEVLYEKKLTVSKASLDGRDLGLYLMEELGEIIDYQLAFLKEVQEKEEEKGVTVVLEKTEYTGLIGLVFNTKTKELPGYEPVVKPPVAEIPPTPFDKGGDDGLPTGQAGSTQSMELTDPDETPDNYPDDSYYYEWLIGNCLSNGGYWYDSVCNAEPEIVESDDSSAPQPSGTMEPTDDPEDTPVCDADNLDLCDTQELCEGADLYWYDSDDDGNEICSFEEPPHPNHLPPGEGDDEDDPEASTFICDADHPTLCDAQGICEDMGLYWYEGVCNIEEEVIK